jgi:hypothetical protein
MPQSRRFPSAATVVPSGTIPATVPRSRAATVRPLGTVVTVVTGAPSRTIQGTVVPTAIVTRATLLKPTVGTVSLAPRRRYGLYKGLPRLY